MSIGNAVIDNDACFRIDPITRNITDESAEKTTLVQYDHNSERFTFSMPRYVEGHDVLGCDKIEVHYKSKISPNSVPGVYEVTDVALVPGDEENVVFTWLVSQNATREVGAIAFLIRLSCCDENANTTYVWNTSVFTGVVVKPGMNNSEAVVEQYADVLEQWKQELYSIAGKLPLIAENGNWLLWDAESKTYKDSGKSSQGQPPEYKNFEVSKTGLASANSQYLSGQFITKQTIQFSTNKNKVDANYTGIYVGDAGYSGRVTKLPHVFNINRNPYGAYISIDNKELGIANVGDCYFAIMQISLTRPEGVTSTIKLSDIYPYEFEKNATTGRDTNVLGLDQFYGWDIIHYVIIPFQIKDNVSRQGIYFNAMDGFNADAAGCSYNVTLHNISVYKATEIVVEDISKLRYFSSDVGDMNVGIGKKTYTYQGSISTVPPEDYVVSGIFNMTTKLLTSLITTNTKNTCPDKTIDIYSDNYGCCKTSHEMMKLKSQMRILHGENND